MGASCGTDWSPSGQVGLAQQQCQRQPQWHIRADDSKSEGQNEYTERKQHKSSSDFVLGNL